MERSNEVTASEYNGMASSYAELSKTAAPWVHFDRPFLERVVVPRLTADTNLLELGCGSGKVLEFLAERGLAQKNMYGIDLSKEQISIAQRALPDATLHVADFTKEPLPEARFDIALSVRSIEYLSPEQLYSFFQTAYSALMQNGSLFVLTGHPLRINNGDPSTYLERGERTVLLPWGAPITLYHKTFSDIIRAALDAQLELRSMDEPEIPALLQQTDPKAAERYRAFGAVSVNMEFVKK